MKRQTLGTSDLEVSAICLGTMTYGTPVGEADAIRLTHWAIDHGINFIDTANMYEGYSRFVGSPGGVAEEILGKALAGRREQVVLATKVGMKVGQAPEDEGTSPAAIRKQLEASLKRLAGDYVDLYYLHRPDPDVPPADILGALQEAIGQGKVRHYGISNYSAEQTAELLQVADQNNLPRPVAHQPPYSLLKRDIEQDLLPLCAREKISVVPYQVLQGGMLTGKYRRQAPPPPDSRMTQKKEWLPEISDELFDRLEDIERQARAKNLTMAQYAIRWVLEQPAVASAIIGVTRAEQIDQAIAAASGG